MLLLLFLLHVHKAKGLIRKTQRPTLGQQSPLLTEKVVSILSPWLIHFYLPCCQVMTYTDLLGRWNFPKMDRLHWHGGALEKYWFTFSITHILNIIFLCCIISNCVFPSYKVTSMRGYHLFMGRTVFHWAWFSLCLTHSRCSINNSSFSLIVTGSSGTQQEDLKCREGAE